MHRESFSAEVAERKSNICGFTTLRTEYNLVETRAAFLCFLSVYSTESMSISFYEATPFLT